MGNYNDFLRIHGKEGVRLKRLYWVYGEEEMFRVLTIRQIKELANVPVHNITHLSAFDASENEIWAALNQHPLDSTSLRVLIVHDAQRLKHLDRMQAWLKDSQTTRSRSATAVFVSTDSGISEEAAAVLSGSTSAMTVKCALPRAEDDRLKRAKEIITRWGPIESISAGVLATRVNFDMADAYSVVQKAALFPEARLTVRAVEMLAPRRADQDLVWALVAVNKRKAAEALPDVSDAAIGRILGSLSTHAEALSRINSLLTSQLSQREVARRLELKEGYVRMLIAHAKFYPRKQAVRRILLLNRLDSAYQSGAKAGVLEALIAAW